jgi:hypothetical protein
MIFPELEEKLHQASYDFEVATSENIVERGESYFELLEEYHHKLLDHPAISPGIHPADYSAASYEALHDTQRVIREALAQTDQEIARVGAILRPFTEITYGEAIETLNHRKYKGSNSWKFGEGRVTDGYGNTLSLNEAAATVLRLRREEYVAKRRDPEK